MSLKLTNRLNRIVSLCDFCDTIIDIGTDHGKVPIELANRGLSNHIIATDIRKEPLLMCESNAKKYLIDKNFDFKMLVSDGLSGIDKNIECGIIISGMGYDLITRILANVDEYNYRYLVLSPHTKTTEFIKFLDKKKIDIDRIETVFEDNKAYFIFKCLNHYRL